MTIDITSLVEAFIMLIGVCITTFLIPYLKSKTSKETQEEINKWVKIAVSAAEQIFTGSGRGMEKKQFVLDWLQRNKIKYDSSKIDAMIESSVYELKHEGLIKSEPVVNAVSEENSMG